ncbi:reverse transcriptase domain-containing protein [Bdellovibrio bacteriovorus]|uniref:reverse transcriptase domain-containing protein n=1 Tax=Bdellovibrio bacteriovorus TaxID=959 RepID=UPI0035A5718A
MNEKMKRIFISRLKYSSAAGIDRIRPEKFESNLDQEVSKIVENIESGKYRFSPYKEMLVLKGRSKFPRVISIPTVRDKLVLSWVLEQLNETFLAKRQFVYEIISKITCDLRDGKIYYRKIDISGFYDNINHELLESDLKTQIADQNLLALIRLAIKNPTTPVNQKAKELNSKGVPQGIPISNYLANFFGRRIDHVVADTSVTFTRYVDDILLLSSSQKDLSKANEELIDKIRSCGLEVNEEKSRYGILSEGFDYLGYSFSEKNGFPAVGIRRSSYEKHYLAILKIFSSFSNKKKKGHSPSLDRLAWDLNLKVTGAILDGERYGWLFFFSQIDEDSKQLYALDSFIDSMLKKNGLSRDNLGIKKHIRAFWEIRKNLKNTKYIPNLDSYSLEKKKIFLLNVCGLSQEEVDLMSDESIAYEFKKRAYRDIRELEKDMSSVS